MLVDVTGGLAKPGLQSGRADRKIAVCDISPYPAQRKEHLLASARFKSGDGVLHEEARGSRDGFADGDNEDAAAIVEHAAAKRQQQAWWSAKDDKKRLHEHGNEQRADNCVSVAPWRLELFFKSTADLHSRVLPFIAEHGIGRINITNKNKNEPLLEWCQEIATALPCADFCVHYSLKWNYSQHADASFRAFRAFCTALSRHKRASLLLVSGGGKKRKLDTVQALERAGAGSTPLPPLYAAFNPYLPDAADAAEERGRLERKLASGCLAGIYLQTGSDLDLLQAGLEFLRSSLPAYKGSKTGSSLHLYGSIFLPNKRLLAQMSYRPWNGVFLNDRYLASVEGAREITQQVLQLYGKYGVVPLVESSVSTTAELRQCLDLLGGKG